MERPPDPGLDGVLRALGVPHATLVGQGGEATVHAIDDGRVVRVLRHGSATDVRRGQELVDELTTHGAPFALPEVVEVGEVDGRWYTIERRLPGRSLMDELAVVEGHQRDALVERHLEAAAAIGRLHLEPRPWYGELFGLDGEPVRTATWREYLAERAARNLGRTTWASTVVDPATLADHVPAGGDPSFVHLDAFAGNMLTDGTSITAVIDIGPYGVVGDARLNALVAAVHLAAPEITPPARRRDVAVARSWLRTAGLGEWFEPTRRWLAAFWSFATDDRSLQGWCRSVLSGAGAPETAP